MAVRNCSALILQLIVLPQQRPLARFSQPSVSRVHLRASRSSTPLKCVHKATNASAIHAEPGGRSAARAESDEVADASMVPLEHIRLAFAILTREMMILIREMTS